MMTRILVCLITTLMLFVACRHEPEITSTPIEEDCVSIPFPNAGEHQEVFLDSFFYNVPYVNPNNPDELVVLEANMKTGFSKLLTVNIVTGARHTIFEGSSSWGLPKWSRTNWIAFGRDDEQIWLVRPDGTALHKITSGIFNSTPEFNYSGDTIAFLSVKVVGNGWHYFTSLAHLNGDIIDTLWHAGVQEGCWQHPNLGLFQHPDQKIVLLNTSNDTSYQILPMQNNGTGIVWINDTEVMWAESEGLYKADVTTLQVEKIKSYCDAITYDNPSYSPQINKVYWDKAKRYWIDSNTVRIQKWIVRMNPDGTDEEEIDIPR